MTVEVVNERVPVPSSSTPGDAAQWGAAGLAIGGVVLIASCTVLVFNILFWRSGPAGIPISLAYAGGIIGSLAVLVLGVFGLVSSVRGWQRAYSDRVCPAFPIAGVVASATGVVAWLIVAIDLIMILQTFSTIPSNVTIKLGQ
jgi:hypothetical protein